jgi:fatty-acyl-CoA synthase
MSENLSKSHLSYARGSTDTSLLTICIGQALEDAAALYGNDEALVSCHQNIRLTYREFNSQVDKIAAGLVALGLKKGDRIGIWSPNNVEWVLTQFATAKAGLILVTLNPAYRLSELEYSLNKVECKAIVLANRFKTSDYVKMIEDLAPEIPQCEPGKLRSQRLPHLELAIVISEAAPAGFITFNDIAKKATQHSIDQLEQRKTQLSCDEPINIQFTSGTTGFPKGATLTHKNILNNGRNVAICQNITHQDRLCIPVPLYHCFGMVMGVLGCVSHGATMILPSEAFDPATVLKTVEAEKCTSLYGVPTMFIAELGLPTISDYDLSTLRTGVMAGSPCPTETMKQVVEVMNMRDVTIAYGMTETSPVSMQTIATDSFEKRVSTVGKVHPQVEVKIVDDKGEILPLDIQGEFCTRGYSVMSGYWADEEKTKGSIDSDGWMHTGDLATMDDQGYVCITGRLKDMIIRGGENVYPREIEEFLYQHPKILDVQVFGVPDNKYGEEICAWLVLKDGENSSAEEIKHFCTGQIAHYKVPRYIKFVTEFPMTVTGKIQKFIMRDQMSGELG